MWRVDTIAVELAAGIRRLLSFVLQRFAATAAVTDSAAAVASSTDICTTVTATAGSTVRDTAPSSTVSSGLPIGHDAATTAKCCESAQVK
jgi:hypothetical protein